MEQQKTKWLHTRLSQDEFDLLNKHFKAIIWGTLVYIPPKQVPR
jgi:hypothetical protein